jgi:hypothetical protein
MPSEPILKGQKVKAWIRMLLELALILSLLFLLMWIMTMSQSDPR